MSNAAMIQQLKAQIAQVRAAGLEDIARGLEATLVGLEKAGTETKSLEERFPAPKEGWEAHLEAAALANPRLLAVARNAFRGLYEMVEEATDGSAAYYFLRSIAPQASYVYRAMALPAEMIRMNGYNTTSMEEELDLEARKVQKVRGMETAAVMTHAARLVWRKEMESGCATDEEGDALQSPNHDILQNWKEAEVNMRHLVAENNDPERRKAKRLVEKQAIMAASAEILRKAAQGK